MTPLKTLAGLQEKATKGPWKSQGRYLGVPNHMSYIAEFIDQNGNWTNEPMPVANAAFIAACGSFDFTALCDEMERMRDALCRISACVADGTKAKEIAREALGGKDE